MDRKEFEQFLENINFKNPMILKSKGVVYTYDIDINDFSVNICIATDLEDGTRVSYKIKQDTFDGFAEFLKIVKPYEGEEI